MVAYLIRNTPVWLRAVLFVSFALTAVSYYAGMHATNGAFLKLVEELAKLSQLSGFSQNAVTLMGATPTQAPAFPLLLRISLPLIILLNIAVGCYLLLLAKFES